MYRPLGIRKCSSTLPFASCFVLWEFFLLLLVMLLHEACSAMSSDFIFPDSSHVDLAKNSDARLFDVTNNYESSWYGDAVLHYGSHIG